MPLLPFGSRTRLKIPEYSTDPSNSRAGDAWVLRSTSGGGGAGAGQPIGLLLALTNAGGTTSTTYQFSYYTQAGSIKRVTIS